MNPNQAEAGPSSPRIPTPPSTPPSSKTASRRRSWFGFVGSPFASTSASQASSSPRRSSFAPDGEGEMGHELSDRSSAKEPIAHARRSSLQVMQDSREEMLTIDGQVETPASIRRMRNSRAHGVDEEQGEVVRLQDLTPRRKGSLRTMLWPTEESGETSRSSPPKPPEGPPPVQPKISPPKPTKPDLSAPIPSSPRSFSLTKPSIRVPPDKVTPLLPTARPLPALPLNPSPPAPADIVITPSSPRKLQKPRSHSRRTSTSMTDLRAASDSEGGRERPHTSGSSRSSSKAVSRKSSMIGLGLPRDLGGQDMLPPPVPRKPQSVSSPQPSRSASPIPKISFAEPEEEKERGRTEKVGEEKKDKAKRARSLSGIFTRSASQPVSSRAGSVVNGGGGPGEEILVDQDHDHSESGKMAGVLEWLGVRKASKRKLSDAKPPAEDDLRRASGEEEKDQGTVRAESYGRLHLRDVSSTTTIMPSAAGDHISPPDTLSVSPSAIAIPSRPSTTSLNQPSASNSNVPSPWQIDTPTSRVPSPSIDTEEMFFDPPSAPWLDGSEAPPQTPEAPSTKPSSAVAKDGRLRSWSDAPIPSPHIVPPSRGSPVVNSSPDQTPPQPSSSYSSRPKLGNRSHSGNSAIIEKMKGVFTKSSARNRSRSKSLLPQSTDGGGVNEFGGLEGGRDRAGTASSASLSSQQWSPAPATNSSLLDLNGRSPAMSDTLYDSPRTSLNGAAYSTPPTARPSTETASGPIPVAVKAARTRGRASTVSFASSAPQTSFLPPPPPISPSLFPISTPPRRRPSAIQRFSSGLLGTSAPSSPKGSLFPLPPRSSGSTFSSAGGAGGDDGQSTATGATSLLLSPGASPRPSNGSASGSTYRGGWKVDIKVEEGETAECWLDRMAASVGRDEIAGVLASSGDELHTHALELYMAEFDFTHNALDVALRRLLMQISLPKETQQIDRVIEAFSKRYEACEPGLFGSKDNTYVLAFSMMMLHTDAFNRNNKNKMSKADYVRNTRMEGVSPITLEAFYDNITYTPFVHFDVDSDVPSGSHIMGGRSRSGSDAITPAPSPTPPSTFMVGSPVTPGGIPNGSTLTPSSGSVLGTTPRRVPTPTTSSSLTTKQPDVYALIAQNNLHPLRVDLERSIPAKSPFSCVGTRPFLEMGRTQNAFVEASILRIGGQSSGTGTRKKAGSVGKRKESDTEGAMSGEEAEVSLRVTKVGTLSRKDDSLDSRKTSRKWKSWSVILTGSQLLFFKDPFWALSLQEQMKADHANAKRDEKGQVLLPRVARFIPDEVFPVKDAVAVWDRTLTGHPNTFRFHLPNRAYLVQAPDEYEMNEWISLINYSAAFKTSGIRMRAGSMRKDQALLAGAAAASSLKRESQSLGAAGDGGPKGRKRFGSVSEDFPTAAAPMPITAPNGAVRTPPSILSVRHSGDSVRHRAKTPDRSDTSSILSGRNTRTSVESESAGSGAKDDGERLGEVFRAVKAELAAEPGLGLGLVNGGKQRAGLRVRIPSSQAVRSDAVKASIRNLSAKITSAQMALDAHLTQARNLAILTPFQRTTRDRISSAVPPLAAKIRDQRLIIAKLGLWISILQCDLDREEKEWAGTREVALQGAKRSLRAEEGVREVAQDVNIALEAGEAPRVRFQGDGVGADGAEAAKEADGGEGLEVLTDTPNDIGPRNPHEEVSTILGTTPQELPVLFRQSSDEAIQQIPDVSPARPEVRRHVSASLI